MNKKLAFAAVTVAAIFSAIYFVAIYSGGTKDLNLRVAYRWFKPATELDPASILTSFDYDLIHNLYSRLVEYDSKFQLNPAAAQSFSTTDEEVIFTFGDKVTTVDGHRIDAQDAEISLKRVVMLGRSGHGDIRRLLCPKLVLKSLNDNCPGIRIENNNLVLRPIKRHYLPLLISALEIADYSIVPRDEIDPKTLKIKSFRNTSGPYFIDSYSNDGQMTLKANPRHYLYDTSMPQTIQVIPTDIMQGPSRLLKGEVDLVTASEIFSGSEAAQVIGDSKRFTVHATQPIRIEAVFFSEAAVRNFSVAQRLYVAQAFAKARARLFPTFQSHPTNQFFQALSDGALTNSQLRELEILRNSAGRPEFTKRIKIGVRDTTAQQYQEALKAYPEFEIVGLPQFPFEYDMKDRPDAYSHSTDSAWTENISLLGHNFESQNFHSIGVSPDDWIEDYLETPEKEARIEKLNRLHFDLLRKAVIYPFNAFPYFAVATKKWRLNFMDLSADTDLWRIRPN